MRRSTLLLTLGLTAATATAGCDGLFGPKENPPAAIESVSSITGVPQVGTTVTASVEVRDAAGQPLGGARVEWDASHGSVSSAMSETDGEGIASIEWTLGTTAGEQTVRATAGSLAPLDITVTVRAGPVAAVAVVAESSVLNALGDTLYLEAVATDQYGNETSVAGFGWSSSAASVATVTSDGRVVAVSEGTTHIEAATGSTVGGMDVVVDQVVTSLSVTGELSTLTTSESVQLAAKPVDANGAAVDSSVTPTWSSSNTAVATVDGAGVVSAVSQGTATITATAGDFTGTFDISVKSGPRPTITSISPAALAAGANAVITGSGFSSIGSSNTVTVDSRAAEVLSASATELTVLVPQAGAGSCGPAGDVEVSVTVDELAATTSHPLSGAPRQSLAVGGSLLLYDGDVGCNELAEAGTYVVNVVNTTNSPRATTAFRLRGTGLTTSGDLFAEPASSPRSVRMASIERERIVVDEGPSPEANPEAEAHLRILEESLALGERLAPGREVAVSSSPFGLRSFSTAAAAPAVGETRLLRIPDLDASGGICSNYLEVEARVVYSGTRAVVFEDVTSPLAGTVDAMFQAVGVEYDTLMHDVLVNSFGDPLIYDDQLDDDGRIHMLFSPVVNNFEAGVAGFVTSADLFPRSQCDSSDFAEIFYGRVPTDTGDGYYDGYTADRWTWLMRSTVIHEVKHITSNVHRMYNDASVWETSWLEESTARISEELWARHRFRYAQNGNVTYAQSIHCEVRPTTCGQPYVMAKHYGALQSYYANTAGLSPLGRTADGDWTFYGSGWLFVRWAIDHSDLTEADFLSALNNETSLQGLDNIEARTAREGVELLTEWSLALPLDDHPTVTGDLATSLFPGWDTRDIFEGYNADYPASYPSPFPLYTQQLSGGSWDVEVPLLHGGSSSIFEVTTSGGQLMELLSSTGDTAPAGLTLAVVRVQ